MKKTYKLFIGNPFRANKVFNRFHAGNYIKDCLYNYTVISGFSIWNFHFTKFEFYKGLNNEIRA